MNDDIFDRFGRQTVTAVTRRRSLRLLGGAGLAGAFVAPTAATASKAGKKRNNRCTAQGARCRTGIAMFCQKPGKDPQACQEIFAPCCAHFARCRVSAGVACVMANE